MPDGAVLAAIELLKDLGMSKSQINDRISVWLIRSGSDRKHWQDLSPDDQQKLGKAMITMFESEFNKRRAA